MENKYVIYYEAPSKNIVTLITNIRNKKQLLSEDSLKKLFSVSFDDEQFPCNKTLLYADPIHGNTYIVELNKADMIEVFTATYRKSFNHCGSRIKYLSLLISKDDIKELTKLDFKNMELSLIYFIEFMKVKIDSFGYEKLI